MCFQCLDFFVTCLYWLLLNCFNAIYIDMDATLTWGDFTQGDAAVPTLTGTSTSIPTSEAATFCANS